MDRVDPEIANLTVLSTEGETVELASLWSQRTVVMGFIRHFG